MSHTSRNDDDIAGCDLDRPPPIAAEPKRGRAAGNSQHFVDH